MSYITEENSGISEFNDSVNSHLTRLNNQVHDENTVKMEKLLSENCVLRRQLPKLKDIKGRNVTNLMILLHQAIDDNNAKIERLEAELLVEKQRHENHRQEHYRRANELEGKIKEFTSRIDDSTTMNSMDIVSVHHGVEEMKSELLLEQINQLEADVEHYQKEAGEAKAEVARLKQHLEDVEQEQTEGASDLEDRYASVIAENEQLKIDLKQRDREIENLRKEVKDGEISEFDPKSNPSERLIFNLRQIDIEWDRNSALKDEIEKLLDKFDQNETYSERCEKLARDRISLEHELHDLSNASLSSSSVANLDTVSKSTNVLLKNSRRFHIVSNRMVTRLRSLLALLAKILLNFNAGDPMVNKILKSSKLDIEADFAELTNALEKLTDSERTMQDSVDQSTDLVATPRADENVNSWMQRARAMEENLKAELAKKEDLYKQYELLKLRQRETLDEKTSLQVELEMLHDTYLNLEKYTLELEAEKKLSVKTLVDAREEYEALSQDLEQAQTELNRVNDVCSNYKNIVKQREEVIKKLEEEVDFYHGCEAQYQEQEKQLEAVFQKFENLKLEGLIDPDSHAPQQQETVMKLAAKVSRLKRIAEESNQNTNAVTRYVDEILLALIGRLNYKDIKCPYLVDPEPHSALMDFIANNSEQVVAKMVASEKIFSKKLNEFINAYGSEESSLKSDIGQSVVVNTSGDIAVELKKCAKKADLLVQLIKKYKSSNSFLQYTPIFEALIDKSREVRNNVYQLLKAIDKRPIKVGALPGKPVSDQLGNIYNVLNNNFNDNIEMNAKNYAPKPLQPVDRLTGCVISNY